MFPAHLAVLLNAFSTAAMVGLIWFVQIIHYPLFDRVGRDGFVAYQNGHTQLTGFVVIPFMLCELVTALYLLFVRPEQMPAWAAWFGAGLVGVAWIATFALSVPQHNALLGGFDARAHALLVQTNWIRTVAWTVRGVLMFWVVGRMVR